MNIDLFKSDLKNLKDACGQTVLKKNTSRIEQIRPKLIFKSEGRYTVIYNLQLLANYSGRNIKDIVQWYTKMLSCSGDYVKPRLTLSGNYALPKLRFLESEYYKKVICCKNCNSPETVIKPEGKVCLNCKNITVA